MIIDVSATRRRLSISRLSNQVALTKTDWLAAFISVWRHFIKALKKSTWSTENLNVSQSVRDREDSWWNKDWLIRFDWTESVCLGRVAVSSGTNGRTGPDDFWPKVQHTRNFSSRPFSYFSYLASNFLSSMRVTPTQSMCVYTLAEASDGKTHTSPIVVRVDRSSRLRLSKFGQPRTQFDVFLVTLTRVPTWTSRCVKPKLTNDRTKFNWCRLSRCV